jgi:hypothetical protein
MGGGGMPANEGRYVWDLQFQGSLQFRFVENSRKRISEVYVMFSASTWATGWMIEGSSPGRGWEISLHHRVQTGSGAHPASYQIGTRGLFPGGVMRPGREVDHSPPSSAKVKNAWSYTSIPPTRLHLVVLS